MDDTFSHGQDSHDTEHAQVPPSLLPSVLARLGLETTPSVGASSISNLHSREWSERAAAIRAFTGSGLAALVVALDDEDALVRATAVNVLGKLGERAPLERLMLMLRDPNWHVRETTMFTLGTLGVRVPTEALVAALQDEDSCVQEAARMMLQQRRLSTVSEKVHAPTGQGNASSQTLFKEEALAHKGIPQRSRQRMYALFHTITQQLQGEKRDMQRKQISSADVAEMERPLAGMISPLQARPQARSLFRLMQGGLALLVIMSITLSLWLVAQHFQPGRQSPISTHGKQSVPPGKDAVVKSIFTDHFSSPFYPYDAWTGDSKNLLYSKTDSSITTLNIATGRHHDFPVSKFSMYPTESGDTSLGTPLLSPPYQYSIGHYFILTNLSHASGEWIASVEFWDVVTGKSIFRHAFLAPINPPDPMVTGIATVVNNFDMALSYDSEELAIFNSDGTIDIWNVASGQKRVTLAGHVKSMGRNPVPASLVWFPDGKHIYLRNKNGDVQVWDTRTGQKTFSFSYPISSPYTNVLVSPDSRSIAIMNEPSGDDPTRGTTSIQIRNATTGALLKTYRKENLAWQSVQWLPDSTHFIVTHAGNPTQELEVWDVFTGQTTLDTMIHSENLITVSDDGKHIVLNGLNRKTLEVWDTLTGRRVTAIDTHLSLLLAPNRAGPPEDHLWFIAGNHIALIDKDTLWVWDMLTGKLLYTAHLAPSHEDHELYWSPDGSYFAVISDKHTTDWPSGPQEYTLQVWHIS